MGLLEQGALLRKTMKFLRARMEELPREILPTAAGVHHCRKKGEMT